MLEKIFDKMAYEATKENALKMLRDDGARIFDLGYKEAKLQAEKEQKERGETTTWDEASEGDKRKYKEDFHCTDELAYWCRKCQKPLSGHWAKVRWWNFCPWCGRKLIREVQNG